MDIANKLNNKSARIGIIGLGYVGLPLAVAFAQAGYMVIGFDRVQERVDQINLGSSYINDVDSEDVKVIIQKDLLKATSNCLISIK